MLPTIAWNADRQTERAGPFDRGSDRFVHRLGARDVALHPLGTLAERFGGCREYLGPAAGDGFAARETVAGTASRDKRRLPLEHVRPPGKRHAAASQDSTAHVDAYVFHGCMVGAAMWHVAPSEGFARLL